MNDYTVPYYKFDDHGPQSVCFWCAGTTITGCQCRTKATAEAKRLRKGAARIARATSIAAPEMLRAVERSSELGA